MIDSIDYKPILDQVNSANLTSMFSSSYKDIDI